MTNVLGLLKKELTHAQTEVSRLTAAIQAYSGGAIILDKPLNPAVDVAEGVDWGLNHTELTGEGETLFDTAQGGFIGEKTTKTKVGSKVPYAERLGGKSLRVKIMMVFMENPSMKYTAQELTKKLRTMTTLEVTVQRTAAQLSHLKIKDKLVLNENGRWGVVND